VYAQVSRLFGHAPDLIAEFKQFLPENGDVTERAHGVDSITQAAADSQAAASKNKKETAAASKKRKAPEPKGAKVRIVHFLQRRVEPLPCIAGEVMLTHRISALPRPNRPLAKKPNLQPLSRPTNPKPWLRLKKSPFSTRSRSMSMTRSPTTSF
jgi:histone deacetylase complex regulatory component SIN3